MCWQKFSEQHVKAAKGTKAAKAMAKKQGSVGEDEQAVAAGSAFAGEAGAVVAGSAVAREAREVAAGSAIAWGGRAICCLKQKMHTLRMTVFVHLVRSPKAWRTLWDPT